MWSKPLHGMGRLRAIILCSVALISAGLIARGLYLGYDLSRPIPYYDPWEFVKRIGDILSGRFGFADLVAQHNEHRIATARVVFLLDLWLADGTGYLSIAVLYLALAAIAGVLALLFARDRGVAGTVFLLCFGLLVSPAQWENLSSGFQVQFALVDLFAVLSLSCLVVAMTETRNRRRAWLRLAMASVFDLLAVFSMASGTLLLIPALWIGLVLRSSARIFWAFVALHLVACTLFAWDYTRSAGDPATFDPLLLVQYAIVYLGGAVRGYPHGPFALGLLDLLCLLAAIASVLLRSRAGAATVDRVQLFATGVALLLLANAFLTAVGRSGLGVRWALSSRYAIQSLLLQPVLLIVLWRESRHWPGRTAIRALFGPGLLAAGTVLSLLTNLSPDSLGEWRGRVDLLDSAGFALAQGLFDDGVLRLVYPNPEAIRPAVQQMAALRLGPFSARYGGLYRPPLNLLAGVDLDALDRCTADFSFQWDASRLTGVKGWAFDPVEPTGGGLAVVVDRSRRDRIVGFGRQSPLREEVDQDLPASVDRIAFDVPLKLPSPVLDGPRNLTVLMVPDQAERPICARTVTIRPPEPR